MNEKEELKQLKQEMKYSELTDIQTKIVDKNISENDLISARRIFNQYKDKNKCEFEKKVYLGIGIFLGLVMIPIIWDFLIELIYKN